MNRFQLKTCSAALLPSVATMLLVQPVAAAAMPWRSKRLIRTKGFWEAVVSSEVRDIAGEVLSQTCVADVGTRFS